MQFAVLGEGTVKMRPSPFFTNAYSKVFEAK